MIYFKYKEEERSTIRDNYVKWNSNWSEPEVLTPEKLKKLINDNDRRAKIVHNALTRTKLQSRSQRAAREAFNAHITTANIRYIKRVIPKGAYEKQYTEQYTEAPDRTFTSLSSPIRSESLGHITPRRKKKEYAANEDNQFESPKYHSPASPSSPSEQVYTQENDGMWTYSRNGNENENEREEREAREREKEKKERRKQIKRRQLLVGQPSSFPLLQTGPPINQEAHARRRNEVLALLKARLQAQSRPKEQREALAVKFGHSFKEPANQQTHAQAHMNEGGGKRSTRRNKAHHTHKRRFQKRNTRKNRKNKNTRRRHK
jgi:hypothetical protein